jgi:hypothetical protein
MLPAMAPLEVWAARSATVTTANKNSNSSLKWLLTTLTMLASPKRYSEFGGVVHFLRENAFMSTSI